jgi:hypothetical protein
MVYAIITAVEDNEKKNNMENNKSVTAVEWLEHEIFRRYKFTFQKLNCNPLEEAIEQAKEMESNKNQKFDEMLEMLQKCKEYFLLKTDAKSEERADAIAQLIEEATKL